MWVFAFAASPYPNRYAALRGSTSPRGGGKYRLLAEIAPHARPLAAHDLALFHRAHAVALDADREEIRIDHAPRLHIVTRASERGIGLRLVGEDLRGDESLDPRARAPIDDIAIA